MPRYSPWPLWILAGLLLSGEGLYGQGLEPTAVAEFGESEDGQTGSEIIWERYPNRAVKIERHVVLDADQNYVNHGPWKMWSPSGEIIAYGEYHYGKLNGRWVRYFRGNEGPLFTGPLYRDFQRPFISEATFTEGVLNGPWAVRDAQDRQISVWGFEQDQPSGTSTWFFPNGQKRQELTYREGRLHGDWLQWGAGSELISKETYIDGKKLVVDTQTHRGGGKRLERTYLVPVGTLTYNWMEGSSQAVAPQEQEKQLHGRATWWHANGQKLMEGQYERGIPTGKFTWWHANGQKQTQGEYTAGNPHGRWLWWHANGQKHIEGEYAAGERTGKWCAWNEEGKIQSVEDYTAGGQAAQIPHSLEAPVEDSQQVLRPSLKMSW